MRQALRRIDATTDISNSTAVLDEPRTALEPAFASEPVLSWDFVTGLNLNLPPTTPIAWTRGLQTDGTWDVHGGVCGGDGGHIMFLGGNVAYFRDLKSAPLTRPDGTPTSNVLEALPGSARVVGAGPATLQGKAGLGGRP